MERKFDDLLQSDRCSYYVQTVATECKGDGDLLQSLEIQDVKTGEKKDLQVNGLFYAIGKSGYILSSAAY